VGSPSCGNSSKEEGGASEGGQEVGEVEGEVKGGGTVRTCRLRKRKG